MEIWALVHWTKVHIYLLQFTLHITLLFTISINSIQLILVYFLNISVTQLTKNAIGIYREMVKCLAVYFFLNAYRPTNSITSKLTILSPANNKVNS